ncbi:unnamed protein product [Symbiodinium necroappetens]|uniref:C3H1-type domain-containing protein n=1 Tax=Symbiodinium necroappetens TaxID=1628268 RepID=A0A812IUP9_9DINO|nr:unnamed protein product [Symbiodinium necroappetens]|mmetsp:Transcript_71669/g.171156  ORF Transcript_71669/g.171156 Transcript_71669/m.171156 type:complete len:203 (+) Transcript_71669:42-650(+)|eukprot:CAMPEP_0181475042 /NCGR_PEP_ID=MMETSP1110-20121109/40975_1 /TAXON_ID=174948 /ORGANISM="Symbiodinium sp., Strain CCMP421" /LENGTH=202 /DNA_ID=CAMNT_0023600257 /DNA_START=42 /DNA_END=650 /DNA_ORIENTATION=-
MSGSDCSSSPGHRARSSSPEIRWEGKAPQKDPQDLRETRVGSRIDRTPSPDYIFERHSQDCASPKTVQLQLPLQHDSAEVECNSLEWWPSHAWDWTVATDPRSRRMPPPSPPPYSVFLMHVPSTVPPPPDYFPEPSVSSRGHYQGRCAAACKYVRKARGCKDGINCARCHICQFCSKGTRKTPKMQFGEATPSTRETRSSTA